MKGKIIMEKEKLIKIFNKIKRNEIRINYKKKKQKLPIGVSKIGGKPSLPKDFEWPYYEGENFNGDKEKRPLSFLAQINLKEASKYDTEGLLPESGLLSFFYDIDTMRWGDSPEDEGCAKVYYFEEGTELHETDIPKELDEEFIVPEFAIGMKKHVSLPYYEDFCKMDTIDKEIKDVYESDEFDYFDVVSEAGYDIDEYGENTKILGYPDIIQDSMEFENEDRILLFEMGTIEDEDSGYELMWGDCGHIYFWIKKQDFKESKFDKVWLILQCG